jgi:hypothetical protein
MGSTKLLSLLIADNSFDAFWRHLPPGSFDEGREAAGFGKMN